MQERSEAHSGFGFAVEYDLDWLTLKLSPDMFKLIREDVLMEWEPNIPRWGYRKAWKSKNTGAQLLALQQDESVPPVLVLSGHTLNVFADLADTSSKMELASKYFSNVLGATRVDIAVDIYDEAWAAHQVAAAAESGICETSAKKITVMRSQGNNPGVTTYFGARTSPRMIRVYSKPLVDDKSRFFTRVEIELKKSAAAEIWDKFLKNPPAPPLESVLAILKTVVSEFKVQAIDDLLIQSGSVKFTQRRSTKYAWQDWYSRQVIPGLSRDYKLGEKGEQKLLWLINEVAGEGFPKMLPLAHSGAAAASAWLFDE